jgi:hypothetical protein
VAWRVFVWAQLLACYHPSVASNMPCASNGDCPTGQMCNAAQVCVPFGTVEDSGIETLPPIDAMHDAPAEKMDAAVPAIAFRQAAMTKPTSSALTMSLPHAVDAGDAILVCLNFPVGGVGTGPELEAVTDSLDNTYDIVVSNYIADGQAHYVAAAYGSPAGLDTLTLAMAGDIGSGGTDWFALEYANLLATSAFDVAAENNGDNTGSNAFMTSDHATTRFGNELILGYAEAPGATVGTGFVQHASESGNLVESQVQANAGSYQATASTTTGSWTMIMATFRGQ